MPGGLNEEGLGGAELRQVGLRWREADHDGIEREERKAVHALAHVARCSDLNRPEVALRASAYSVGGQREGVFPWLHGRRVHDGASRADLLPHTVGPRLEAPALAGMIVSGDLRFYPRQRR